MSHFLESYLFKTFDFFLRLEVVFLVLKILQFEFVEINWELCITVFLWERFWAGGSQPFLLHFTLHFLVNMQSFFSGGS